MRRRTWPEGYWLVKRTDNPQAAVQYGIQRIADGLVAGFWRDCGEALTDAWEIHDGGGMEFKASLYPVEPCADMPIPF